MHYTELFLKGPFVIVPSEYLRGGHYIAMIILFQWASICLTCWMTDLLSIGAHWVSSAMVCSLDHCALCSVTILPYNLALSSVCDTNRWRRVCYVSHSIKCTEMTFKLCSDPKIFMTIVYLVVQYFTYIGH